MTSTITPFPGKSKPPEKVNDVIWNRQPDSQRGRIDAGQAYCAAAMLTLLGSSLLEQGNQKLAHECEILASQIQALAAQISST